MNLPFRIFLAAGAGVAVGLVAPAAAVAAPTSPPDPPIVVEPANPHGNLGPPSVGIGVTDPGAPAAAGTRGTANHGGRTVCRWQPAPDLEQVLRRLPASVSNGAGPGQRGTGGNPQDRVDPKAHLYQRVCDGLIQGYAWFGPGQTTALPTPGDLAREAYTQLRLPTPTPGHSPDLRLTDGQAAVLVGEHTWLWTDPSRFTARSKRLQVGPVWALVTARPVALTFDPGTGDAAASCVGPGTPYVPGRYGPHAASPTCDFQYVRSSAGRPGGVVRAVYGIRWQVSWVGSTGTAPAAGQLPDMTSQTTVALAVAEGQALGTA